MTARGGGPTPTELRNMGPWGVPTYPLGIAERWHRNLHSLAKERNPGRRLGPLLVHRILPRIWPYLENPNKYLPAKIFGRTNCRTHTFVP